VRQPNERELQQTTVLLLPLEEASAKVRTGPPLDDEEDYDLPIWAGLIPLQIVANAPVSDPLLKDSVEMPAYARNYQRGASRK
jgi:hypothetical protein